MEVKARREAVRQTRPFPISWQQLMSKRPSANVSACLIGPGIADNSLKVSFRCARTGVWRLACNRQEFGTPRSFGLGNRKPVYGLGFRLSASVAFRLRLSGITTDK